MTIKTYLTTLITFLCIENLSVYVSAFSGDITSYGASEENQFCGFKSFSWNYNNLMTAAINMPMIDNSLSCGLCANVKYKDKIETVLIDNLCPECKFGDLDLSNQAWQKIVGNSNYGREKATWEFVECDKFIKNTSEDNGGLILRPHHINYWWLSITPSNMKCGISNMFISLKEIDNGAWKEMERNNNAMNGLYFIYHNNVRGEFKFKIVSKFGEEIETDSYTEIKETFFIKKQFACKETEDCGEFSIISLDYGNKNSSIENAGGNLRGSDCQCK